MSVTPPLVIELFGQPGAGKSTLTRAAAVGQKFETVASLRGRWDRKPVLAKGLLLARALLDVPSLSRVLLLVADQRLFRMDCLFRLARLLIKSHWVRSQEDVLLLEEGFLQDLWSIFYSADRLTPEPQPLSSLIRCLYRDLEAQIVYLEIAPHSAFNRIRGRRHGKSRLDRLPEADLRRHLTATAELSHRLIDAAKLAGLRVHSLDASTPIGQNADRLRNLLPVPGIGG